MDAGKEEDPLVQPEPPVVQICGTVNQGLPPTSSSDPDDDITGEPPGGEGDDDGDNIQMPFRMRVMKTCAMASIYVCLGLSQGIISPTMLDLAGLLSGGKVAPLSQGLMMKAVGILVGSFVGGLVADTFRKRADLCLFIGALFGGASCAVVPWLPSVTVLGVAMFVQGTVQGTHNVASSSLTIAIWGERAATPVHFLHMCYTLGAVISQPVSGIFVINRNDNSSSSVPPSLQHAVPPGESFLTYLEDGQQQFDNLDIIPGNGTQIYIPYAIFGGLEVVLSFSFLVFYLCGLKYTSATIASRTSIRDMLNPAACTGGRGAYGVYMLLTLFLLYVGIVARDNSLGLFLCPTGTLIFGMSGFTASLLGLAFNISQLVGRASATLLALCVPIQVLVFVEIIAISIFMVALTIWGLNEALNLWLLSCAAGLFIGPNYPSIMAWADRYIEARGLVVTVIDLGIGIGAFMATLVGGILFQDYGPETLFYMSVAGAGFMLALMVPIQIASCFVGDRHKARRGEEATGDSDSDSNHSQTSVGEASPLIN